jgi:hypothetical protein
MKTEQLDSWSADELALPNSRHLSNRPCDFVCIRAQPTMIDIRNDRHQARLVSKIMMADRKLSRSSSAV